MYSVIVELGNSGPRVYATVPDFEAADKLRTAAKKRGYRDAKVVNSTEFAKEARSNVWGQSRAESLDWEARRQRLHDLWMQSEESASRQTA